MFNDKLQHIYLKEHNLSIKTKIISHLQSKSVFFHG